MNVLIFGASGGIGKWAVHYALQNGHQVTAYVRHPGKMQIADDHLTIMQGELTDKGKIIRALSGQDAVIWCVGIPMKRSYPRMHSLEGHRVLIQAMREQGVKDRLGYPQCSVFAGQKFFHYCCAWYSCRDCLPSGKEGDGVDWKATPDIGAGLDVGSLYGPKKYSLYRQSKSELWGCENEIQYFAGGYWGFYGRTAEQQPLYWLNAHNWKLIDSLKYENLKSAGFSIETNRHPSQVEETEMDA